MHVTETGADTMFRRRRWLACLVGDHRSVEEARQLNLDQLAEKCLRSSTHTVDQIDIDVPRSGVVLKEEKLSLRRVLMAWCALNEFGYVQGMNLIAAALLKYMREGRYPEHDALACLSGVMALNAGLLPFHMEDEEPMKLASVVVSKMWLQVSVVEPSLQQQLLQILDLFEIACLRIMSVCFVTFFSPDTLHVVWDYVFENDDSADDKTSSRCRHVFSSAVLLQKKLWLFGEDAKQNFVIFEATCGLMDEQQIVKIVDLAKYLERLEKYN